jgi:hypothetical protein
MEQGNHRVSQFALDGTFIGIFTGTSKEGSGNGDFDEPLGITILESWGRGVLCGGSHRRTGRAGKPPGSLIHRSHLEKEKGARWERAGLESRQREN